MEEKNKKLIIFGILVVTLLIGLLLGMMVYIDQRVKGLESIAGQSSEEVTPKKETLSPEEIPAEKPAPSKEFPEEGFQEEAWKIVATFEGLESQNTQTFFIPGDWWKINWWVDAPVGLEPGKEEPFFQMFLYKIGEKTPIKEFRTVSSDPQWKFRGTYASDEYISEGKENFYFDIVAKGLKEGWKIKVSTL